MSEQRDKARESVANRIFREANEYQRQFVKQRLHCSMCGSMAPRSVRGIEGWFRSVEGKYFCSNCSGNHRNTLIVSGKNEAP